MFPQLPFNFFSPKKFTYAYSDLVVPAITLTTSISDIKYADSSLEVSEPIISTNVSTIKIINSDLVVSPVETIVNVSDIKSAISDLEVSAVDITAQMTSVSSVASDLVIPSVSFDTSQPLQLWTPSAITTQLWFDASDQNTLFDAVASGVLPSSNGAIARWVDKSGGSNNIVQSTLGSRPIRKISELNGLDMVRLDGVDDLLLGSAPSLSAFTAFFVSKNLNGGTGASPFSYSDGTYWTGTASEPNAGILWQRVPSGNAQYGTQASSTTFNSAIARISVVRCSTTVDSGWIDGTALSTGSASVYTISLTGAFNVGRRELGSVYCSGDIGEIILIASAASTDIRQKTEGYLAHKWGLIANLPSDHPYKTTPPYI